MKKDFHQKGKTLLETLAVIALVCLISVGTFMIYNFTSDKAKAQLLAQSIMGFVKERQHANLDTAKEHKRNVKGPFDIGIKIVTESQKINEGETLGEQFENMKTNTLFGVEVSVKDESLCSELMRTDFIQSEMKKAECPEKVTFYFKKNPHDNQSFPAYEDEDGNLEKCPENAICSANGFTCIEGYYKNGKECAECGENVKTCNDNGEPTECKEGYYLKGGACENCQSGIPECDKDNVQCESGYYKKDGECVKCPENHSSCNTENGDFTCQEGYYKKDDACAECGTGVAECDDDGNPTKCEKAYYLKEGKCEPCDEGVAECDNNGAPIKCEEGYYKKDGACAECGENVKTCDDNGEPTECEEGYYKNGKACAECGENVKTCNDNGEPTECKEGYYLKGGACQPCKTGETCEGCTDPQYPNWNGEECVCTQTSCSSDHTCNTSGICVKKIDPDLCPKHSSTTVRNGYQIGTSGCYCMEGFRVNDDGTGCTAENNEQCPDNSSILSAGEDSAGRNQTSVSGCYCHKDKPYWNGEECSDNPNPDLCPENSSTTVRDGYQIGTSGCYCMEGFRVNDDSTGCTAENNEQCPDNSSILSAGEDSAGRNQTSVSGCYCHKDKPYWNGEECSASDSCSPNSPGYAVNDERCCDPDETLLAGYCCSGGASGVYFAPGNSEDKMCCSGKSVKARYIPGGEFKSDEKNVYDYCCPLDATGYGYNPATRQKECCTGKVFRNTIAPDGEKYNIGSTYCCPADSEAYSVLDKRCCTADEMLMEDHCCPSDASGYSVDDERCCTANEIKDNGHCCPANSTGYAVNDNRCCEVGETLTPEGYCCPSDSTGYAVEEKRCCVPGESVMDGYCCASGTVGVCYTPDASGTKTCCSEKLEKSRYTPGGEVYPNAVQFEYCCPANTTGYGYNPETQQVGCCTGNIFGEKIAPNGYKYSYLSAYCCPSDSTGYAKAEKRCCGADEVEIGGHCCPSGTKAYCPDDGCVDYEPATLNGGCGLYICTLHWADTCTKGSPGCDDGCSEEIWGQVPVSIPNSDETNLNEGRCRAIMCSRFDGFNYVSSSRDLSILCGRHAIFGTDDKGNEYLECLDEPHWDVGVDRSSYDIFVHPK